MLSSVPVSSYTWFPSWMLRSLQTNLHLPMSNSDEPRPAVLFHRECSRDRHVCIVEDKRVMNYESPTKFQRISVILKHGINRHEQVTLRVPSSESSNCWSQHALQFGSRSVCSLASPSFLLCCSRECRFAVTWVKSWVTCTTVQLMPVAWCVRDQAWCSW